MTYRDAPIRTVILIIFSSIALSSLLISYHFSYAQQARLNDSDILVLMVNLERIRAQISLAQNSLDNGDIEMSFAHAYIPHSVTFPSIKKIVEEVNPEPAKRLETLLTDLPINIRAKNGSHVDLGNALQAINTLLSDVLNQAVGSNQTDKGMTLQTITYLLKDAGKSYVMSNSSQSINGQQLQDLGYKSYTVNYENALGLFNVSSANYAKVAGLIDDRRNLELDSFFNEIQKSMVQKADQNSVLNLISAVERDINEELSLSNGNATAASENEKYLSEIRRLLSSVITEVKDNADYETADSYTVKAYLDNYEYLEAPLESVDPKLMAEIERDERGAKEYVS
jgi:high-affinity iron transporter